MPWAGVGRVWLSVWLSGGGTEDGDRPDSRLPASKSEDLPIVHQGVDARALRLAGLQRVQRLHERSMPGCGLIEITRRRTDPPAMDLVPAGRCGWTPAWPPSPR